MAGTYRDGLAYPPADGHPSKYKPGLAYRVGLTTLIETNALPLNQAATYLCISFVVFRWSVLGLLFCLRDVSLSWWRSGRPSDFRPRVILNSAHSAISAVSRLQGRRRRGDRGDVSPPTEMLGGRTVYYPP